MIERVSFLSTHGKGLKLNLKLIDEYLKFDRQFTTDYFMTTLSNVTGAEAITLKKEIEGYVDDAQCVICADLSMPEKYTPTSFEQKRIYIAEPVDILFDIIEQTSEQGEELVPKKSLDGYNIIISPCTAFGDIIDKKYRTKHAKLVTGIGLPVVDLVCNRAQQEMAKERFLCKVPAARGKKIMLLWLNGTEGDWELTGFINSIPDDVFVLLNQIEPLKKVPNLPLHINQKLFCFTDMFKFEQLIMVADTLVTNVCFMAQYYAPTGKPFMVVNGDISSFLRQFAKRYPSLCIDSVMQANKIWDSTYDSKSAEEYRKYYCPVPTSDSVQRITALI